MNLYITWNRELSTTSLYWIESNSSKNLIQILWLIFHDFWSTVSSWSFWREFVSNLSIRVQFLHHSNCLNLDVLYHLSHHFLFSLREVEILQKSFKSSTSSSRQLYSRLENSFDLRSIYHWLKSHVIEKIQQLWQFSNSKSICCCLIESSQSTWQNVEQQRQEYDERQCSLNWIYVLTLSLNCINVQ